MGRTGILTGGWVGCEVLNHAPLHCRDPPATQDYSIYRNDTLKMVRGRAAYYEEMWDTIKHEQENNTSLQHKLPVTVLCPSVRLLQKSSTMDITSMSCRWKPDSWFHQLCQYAMSWEPWWWVDGCKQRISRIGWQAAVCIIKTSPVTVFLPPLHLLQTELSTSGSHIAEWQRRQRSSL